MSVVRLLLKRTGVRRPAPVPRREVLLEVEEVFRVDVIAAAFEGALPPLRVVFKFIQPDSALQADYPLELPEERFRPRMPDHAMRRFLIAAYDMIFSSGGFDAWDFDFSGQFADFWDLYGNWGARVWREELQAWLPSEFFSFSGLLAANKVLLQLEEDEREMCQLIIGHILDFHPDFGLAALSHFNDIGSLGLLQAYLMDPRNTHVPERVLGDNELLVAIN